LISKCACEFVFLCFFVLFTSYITNLLFCGMHFHMYRAYLLLLLRTQYLFARLGFISNAPNIFSFPPIISQRISLRIPRARFLALGPVTKKTAGFPGFCPLQLCRRSGKYSLRYRKNREKPRRLVGFLGYCLGRMMRRDMKRCLLKVVSARGSISNRFHELQAIKEILKILRSALP
jgi:hypothetical protein